MFKLLRVAYPAEGVSSVLLRDLMGLSTVPSQVTVVSGVLIMTTWEYKHAFYATDDFTFPSKRAIMVMNYEGQDGWELVSIVPHKDYHADLDREREPIAGFLCVFKRPC